MTKTKKLQTERACAIHAGFTRAEAQAWTLASKLTDACCALPRQIASDHVDLLAAVRVIRDKLLARPTLRRYLKAAKQAREDRPN